MVQDIIYQRFLVGVWITFAITLLTLIYIYRSVLLEKQWLTLPILLAVGALLTEYYKDHSKKQALAKSKPAVHVNFKKLPTAEGANYIVEISNPPGSNIVENLSASFTVAGIAEQPNGHFVHRIDAWRGTSRNIGMQKNPETGQMEPFESIVDLSHRYLEPDGTIRWAVKVKEVKPINNIVIGDIRYAKDILRISLRWWHDGKLYYGSEIKPLTK